MVIIRIQIAAEGVKHQKQIVAENVIFLTLVFGDLFPLLVRILLVIAGHHDDGNIVRELINVIHVEFVGRAVALGQPGAAVTEHPMVKRNVARNDEQIDGRLLMLCRQDIYPMLHALLIRHAVPFRKMRAVNV